MSPWSPHSSLGRPHHFFHKSFPGSKGFAHILNGKGPRGPGADSLEEVDGSPEGGAGGGGLLEFDQLQGVLQCAQYTTPILFCRGEYRDH